MVQFLPIDIISSVSDRRHPPTKAQKSTKLTISRLDNLANWRCDLDDALASFVLTAEGLADQRQRDIKHADNLDAI